MAREAVSLKGCNKRGRDLPKSKSLPFLSARRNGVPLRGLKNLGTPCEGERVVTFCIVQKVTKKHAGLRPATSIQIAGRYEIFAKIPGVHQVTGNTENCSFPGIAGNDLNRCEVLALQRKELERTEKEQRYSLVDSRLWLGANGRWRVEKGFSEWAIRKGLSKWIAFGLRKRATFRLMQSQPIKKSFFSAQQDYNFPPHPN